MIHSLARRQGSHSLERLPVGFERLAVEACGRTWLLDRVGDLESRWEALGESEFGDDERIPYWCELWPASLLVSWWLGENAARIAGRTCLDLGCGLGLTALVAADLGARVIGMDYEQEALAFARHNAHVNGVEGILWTATDWRAPGVQPHSVDFMWGGDIIYERRFLEPLAELFDQLLTPGGHIWLGEPQRGVSRSAWDWLAQRGWTVRNITTRPVPSEGYTVTVNLRELIRADESAG